MAGLQVYTDLGRRLRQAEAEREFEETYGPREYVMVELPRSQWRRCSTCGGSGQYLLSGDLHRSEGWVPCGCDSGVVKRERREVRKRIRVPCGRREI